MLLLIEHITIGSSESAHFMRTLRRTPWAASLLLFATSLAAAVAGAELALRLLFDHHDVHPRGLYSADAAVGYVPSPGFVGTLVREEFEHEITIGRSGLRHADPRPRRPATFRIVCLGDSFTFGLGVADDEAYPHLLEQRLARRFPGVDVQVLNASVPGYGTVDQLRFFESRIELLDPDLVILQFLAENDFNDNRRPALGRVEIRDGWLHAAEPPRPQPHRALEWLKEHSVFARRLSEHAGYLAARLGLAAATDGDRFDAADAAKARDLLKKVVTVARQRGSDSVLVFATSQTPVVSERPMSIAAARVVEEAAQAAGAGFLDLTPTLRERDDRFELYYRLDGHWTPKGHAAAADAIAARVETSQGEAIAARASRHLAAY